MSQRFMPESDILIIHRQDTVRHYMSPAVQKNTPHFHYQYELILTVGGSAVFNVSGKNYKLEPGTILCISNLENHFIISYSEGYDRFAVRFSSEALSELIHDPLLLSIFKQRPEGFCHLYTCSAEELKRYILLLRIMLAEYQGQKPYWDYLIASKMRDILVCMYRKQPEAFPGTRSQAGHMVIFDIQNYIEGHLTEDLRLETIAGRFFINQYYLSHRFPYVTGYTFKQYVVMTRLSKAKDLLLHTQREIQDIAVSVGFSGASHFVRIFRQNEGITPLQYRNRAKGTKKG